MSQMLDAFRTKLANAVHSLLVPEHLVEREATFKAVVAQSVKQVNNGDLNALLKQAALVAKSQLSPKPATPQESIIMSLKTFIQDVESEASKIEKDVIAFLPSISTDLAVTSTVLTYAAPVLQTVVTLEGGQAAGALVAKVITDAQQDIIAAKTVITITGEPTSALGLISNIQANLNTLLTDAKITNPTSVKIITTVVNDLAAIIKALSPATAVAAA